MLVKFRVKDIGRLIDKNASDEVVGHTSVVHLVHDDFEVGPVQGESCSPNKSF